MSTCISIINSLKFYHFFRYSHQALLLVHAVFSVTLHALCSVLEAVLRVYVVRQPLVPVHALSLALASLRQHAPVPTPIKSL